MKSLLSNYVQEILASWTDFNQTAKNTAEKEISSFPEFIEGLQGSAASFFAADFLNHSKTKLIQQIQYNATGRYSQEQQKAQGISSSIDVIAVVPAEKDCMALETDLNTSFDDSVEIHTFSWWGTVPYRPASKGSAVFGKRAAVLSKLVWQNRMLSVSLKPRIFIVPERAFLSPVPDPEYVRSLIFSVSRGQNIDPVALAEKISSAGYTRVPKTTVAGEFTLRGEVLDIFLPGEQFAYRIIFDFDTVSNIKAFIPETQSTVPEKESIENLLIFPMKEVIWSDELILRLEEKLKSTESADKNHLEFTENAVKAAEKLLSELKIHRESEGEELLYSLLWDKKYSILDYINENSAVFYFDYDRLFNARENFEREFSGMFRTARQEFPALPPSEILFSFETLSKSHQKSVNFKTLHSELEEDSIKTVKIQCDASRGFFGNINYLKEELSNLTQDGWKIYIFADNANQSLRIKELLKEFDVTVIPAAISEGFGIQESKTLVIQENEIFDRRKRIPKTLGHVKSAVIDTFIDLNEGDYVVHVNYGIGIFRGIQRIKAMGNERDYIKLEYADEEFCFVPIEQVNLVQRYIGSEGENPHIDKIGSKSWENRKNRVKKAVEDLAEKLISLYSRRKASRGFPFPKDSEWQTAFEASFPYEDTEDQYNVNIEIKKDMEKTVPMDRLLCGDVGYGKTELAMRAAFKAVMGGKQVAFLAPTTILAEQHYETCLERFKNFPVTIKQLSRFVSPKEQKKILENLKNGEVDILIGTHRILQKDVVFKDLGFMIIDEEQRFGVKDKERLKSLKANIDCLSMSATPIPRTLHMSLLKIRDMSLLTTPPQTRKPVETVVEEFTEERVIRAIRNEVERGGQVFFLHNRVESLEETRIRLEKMLPEMTIDCAHGQMSTEELDDVFRRFKLGGFHVLVATTIIENGIDIPNVNTIIIDRADMYGVSQLYQLRGRVGRSDRKAYAYLLYPENKVLSEIAMKRLQVISDFTELGSGFKIAMKDMEIRGAGNLLGRDQSGNVYSVGFDLYVKLLNEAVERLTKENYEEENEVLMELEYSGFIPDTYVQNIQTKMEIYKKIAGIHTKEELEKMYGELEDRFGPIPEEVYSLLSLAEVRIIAKKLFIKTVKERKGVVTVEFGKVSCIKLDKLMNLIKKNPSRIKLDAQKPNVLMLSTGNIGLREKSEFLRENLEMLE